MSFIYPEEIKEIIKIDNSISNCSEDQVSLITELVEDILKKIIDEIAESCKLRNGKNMSMEDFKKVVIKNDYYFLEDIFKIDE